jgi:TRAP-type mannitol/chloroaromatic compound transport system permease small subunit
MLGWIFLQWILCLGDATFLPGVDVLCSQFVAAYAMWPWILLSFHTGWICNRVPAGLVLQRFIAHLGIYVHFKLLL